MHESVLAMSSAQKKSSLHPRNRHQGRYNLESLVKKNPALKPFLKLNPKGEQTVDFSNSQAVVELNKALLLQFYKLEFWELPKGFLCPPVPGRADYIHYLADLLMANGIKRADFNQVKVLDIGTGANLAYPIIGAAEYGWKFTGSDVDAWALENGKKIVQSNKALSTIRLRQQPDIQHIFNNVIKPKEYYHLSLCNPPFHESAAAAAAGSQRKVNNLNPKKRKTKKDASLNFGGQANELWCEGGELRFVKTMIQESVDYSEQVGWFTCLISKKDNLAPLRKLLKRLPVKDVKTVTMTQGQKVSRFIAWTFVESLSVKSKKNNR